MFLQKTIKVLSRCSNQFRSSNVLLNRSYSIYEPDYLDSLKPKFPIYDTLNFQIKGYDYPVLESYQKFLHNTAEALELDVADSWANPPKHLQVKKFKSQSTTIDSEYKLTVYERNVQICDVQTPIYATLIRIAQAALPEGVTLNVVAHNDDHDEVRYVPDKDLLELKAELEQMGGPVIQSKKK